MGDIECSDLAGRRDGERGQILVMFTLVLVVLMGFAALVIDVGVLRKANQDLWNSLDSGALAGAVSLPDDSAAATAAARRFATENYPGLDPATISVGFRCVVGDRNNDGTPDPGDVPAVCNPGVGGVRRLALRQRDLRRAMRPCSHRDLVQHHRPHLDDHGRLQVRPGHRHRQRYDATGALRRVRRTVRRRPDRARST